MTLEAQVAELLRAVNARNDDLKKYLEELEDVKRENARLRKESLTTSFEVRLENTVTIGGLGLPLGSFGEPLTEAVIARAESTNCTALLSEFTGVVGVFSEVVDLDLILEVGEGVGTPTWGCLRISASDGRKTLIVKDDEKPQMQFAGMTITPSGGNKSRLRFRIPKFSQGGTTSPLQIVNLGQAKMRIYGFAVYGRRG